MERREFVAAFGAMALAISGTAEAAGHPLPPDVESMPFDEATQGMLDWADAMLAQNDLDPELRQSVQGFRDAVASLGPRENRLLAELTNTGPGPVDEFTACDIKTLMVAAESGLNAGFCANTVEERVLQAVEQHDLQTIKRILVEGKVAVDRHNYVVTKAVVNPADKWKLEPIRQITRDDGTGTLRSDGAYDWLWGMRITYLDVVPPGKMIMWTDLAVDYEPLTVKDPNAVVIVYI